MACLMRVCGVIDSVSSCRAMASAVDVVYSNAMIELDHLDNDDDDGHG